MLSQDPQQLTVKIFVLPEKQKMEQPNAV